MENKFRIVLFNSRTMQEFKTYDYPLLPNVGDSIRLDDEFYDDHFIVQDRIFTVHSEKLLSVVLNGVLEREENRFNPIT